MASSSNPGGATGSVGTPTPKPKAKPKASANPGGATGSVGAPVSPIGTAAKSAPALGSIASSVATAAGTPTSVGALGSIASGITAPARPAAPAAPASPTAGTAPTDLTPEESGVYGPIASLLGRAGLQSLWQDVWDKSLHGEGIEQIMLELQQTPAFKARFPGIDQAQAQGKDAPSVGEYLTYEKDAAAKMQEFGLDPATVNNRALIGKLIGGNVSIDEFNSRLGTYYQATQQIPAEARNYLKDNFGIGTGDLMNVYLNPDEHLPVLQNQVNAATIGGQAATTGWGALDVPTALRLAMAGVTGAQAQQSFSKLAGESELNQTIEGHSVSKADMLAAEFDGNAAAQKKIADVAAGRVAAFQGGGQYVNTPSGVSSLRDPNAFT